MTLRQRLSIFSLLLILAAAARADDWPQWLGPQRDGMFREKGTVDKFPAGGPKMRWRSPVRSGYAGPAVSGGKVFLLDFQADPNAPRQTNPFDRTGRPGSERVLCISEADGKLLWSHEYRVGYTISYGAGPRSTPAVEGNRVYTLGAEGHIHCLDTDSGKVIWSKHVASAEGPTPTWGFAGHPLIDGDRLIVLTTGRAATAFNKNSGEILWQSLAIKDPGYAPPMIFNLGGKRTLILWHPSAVNGLDPVSGSLLWSHPLGPVRNNVSITTPAVELNNPQPNRLFITSAYTGGLMLQFSADQPKPAALWHNARREGSRRGDALHTLMSAPAFIDGHIYGVDFQGELTCIDAQTGARKWDTLSATTGPDSEGRTWATVFLTPTTESNKFFLANDQGDLIIARLTPQGYTELSRAHVLDPTNRDAQTPVIWCHPAYANGAMFWRNDQEMICVELK